VGPKHTLSARSLTALPAPGSAPKYARRIKRAGGYQHGDRARRVCIPDALSVREIRRRLSQRWPSPRIRRYPNQRTPEKLHARPPRVTGGRFSNPRPQCVRRKTGYALRVPITLMGPSYVAVTQRPQLSGSGHGEWPERVSRPGSLTKREPLDSYSSHRPAARPHKPPVSEQGWLASCQGMAKSAAFGGHSGPALSTEPVEWTNSFRAPTKLH
jgi:hypothetical protein